MSCHPGGGGWEGEDRQRAVPFVCLFPVFPPTPVLSKSPGLLGECGPGMGRPPPTTGKSWGMDQSCV